MTAALVEERSGLFMSQPPASPLVASDDLLLAAVPSAIPCARMLVETVVPKWRLDQRCVDAASQTVTLLVGHSVA